MTPTALPPLSLREEERALFRIDGKLLVVQVRTPARWAKTSISKVFAEASPKVVADLLRRDMDRALQASGSVRLVRHEDGLEIEGGPLVSAVEIG
jgi:hypothetical protein